MAFRVGSKAGLGFTEVVTEYGRAPIYTTIAQGGDGEAEYPAEKPVRRKRHLKDRFCFLLSFSLGVLWLAPIIFLLYVNINNQTIGAAAWCPSYEGCNVISYQVGGNKTTASLSAKYDLDNHNLLGALQFVAKALEVWYVYLATSLVWYVTVWMAKRPGGFPIGYFLTHLEFADLRVLLDPILYQSGGTPNQRSHSKRAFLPNTRIFLAIVILMCIITNLMGPSVAVLLIPNLSWNTNPQTPVGQFNQLQSAQAPNGENAINGCNATDLQNGQWDCTSNVYGYTLDAIVSSVVDEMNQNLDLSPDSDNATIYSTSDASTVEESIPFLFNTTRSANNTITTIWASSRQTLRGLSSDFQDLYTVVLGSTTNQTILNQYQQYNSSLQLVLQRSGPIIALPPLAGIGLQTVTTVAENQMIRCFQGFTENAPAQKKCMRTGTAWNSSNEIMNFTIGVSHTIVPIPAIVVNAYWSDRAIYLNDTSDPCFANGTLPEDSTCDYDSYFGGPRASETVPGDNMSDMFVTEWTSPNSSQPGAAMVMQFFPRFGFATYSVDVTQIYPALPLSMVLEPPQLQNMTPIVVHPAWFLAAWSTVNGGDLPNDYDAPYLMQQSIGETMASTDNSGAESSSSYAQWADIAAYSMAQAASFVSYTTSPTPSNTDKLPTNQPLLWTSVYNKVWGWGLDSRTSKLGLVVCILGSLSVLVRTVMLVLMREKERSSVEILTSAMEHQHLGEIARVDKEPELARLRYRMSEEPGEERLRFLHMD